MWLLKQFGTIHVCSRWGLIWSSLCLFTPPSTFSFSEQPPVLLLHLAPATFLFFYSCSKRAFPLLAWQPASRNQERKGFGGVGVCWGWTVGQPRGLLLPRRHRGMFVSASLLVVPCVLAGSRGPVCHISDLLLKFCCQG